MSVCCVLSTIVGCSDDSPAATMQQPVGATPSMAAGSSAVQMAAPDAQTSPPASPDASTRDAATSSPRSDAGAVASHPDAALDAGMNEADDDASQVAPPPMPADGPSEWVVSAPRKLGVLVSRAAHYAQQGLQVYGSDMGHTFEHDGKILMLFGDTYADSDSACDTSPPHDDDMVGTLPLEYKPGLPVFEALTEPSAPTEFRKVRLLREDRDVVLDAFKVPVSGFSDGENAFAIFQSQEPVRCDASSGTQQCPMQQGVECIPNIPVCKPAPITVPITCEILSAICLGSDCRADECVDTHSSQYDGSARGNAASVLSVVDIAKARADDRTTFDSVATWRTNSFSHPNVRSVVRFDGGSQGNDYSPGHGSLFIWGRSGMVAEQDREARVYFATQRLPIEPGAFKPQYFAGLDMQSGEPRWSDDAAQAQPLALDGKPGGDPHEELAFVGTSSVSWLGAPINRWVMMYGGDVGDFMLADPSGTRSRPNAGSIVMRFADHPWGPWTPAVPHLKPGSPTTVGDAYGPGGVMFHPDCVDQGDQLCARKDPYVLSPLRMCVEPADTEVGRLYTPNIIDPYTRPNARGGLDISWVVSTWVPYGLVVFETSFDPAPDNR